MHPRSILFVDDEQSLLDIRRFLFEKLGYAVWLASSGRQALRLLESVGVDVVVVDYLMPEMDGAETARRIREVRPTIPIVLSSGCLTLPDRVTSLVDVAVSKGEHPGVLLKAIEEQIAIAEKHNNQKCTDNL